MPLNKVIIDTDPHPHHTSPETTWLHLFDPLPRRPLSDDPIMMTTAATTTHENLPVKTHLFKPSGQHAVDEILTLLSNHPPDTLTLIALGPLTNFALAAAKSPDTFLRAKTVLVMGGAIDVPGNITPVGEFNCLADPIAAARLYALTSPDPRSTVPLAAPLPPTVGGGRHHFLEPYPPKEDLGERRLKVILFPLDVTTPHILRQAEVDAVTRPLMAAGSPLAEWVSAFTSSTFRKNASLQEDEGVQMSLHDPVVVWYALGSSDNDDDDDDDVRWEMTRRDEDIRVETAGQWTRGMCVVDRRDRKRLTEAEDVEGAKVEVSGDRDGWLSRWRGNRVGRCIGTPGGGEVFGKVLLNTIFGRRGW
ncbi:MAG: hypothetical protein Q9163_005471 [Psora crenata]